MPSKNRPVIDLSQCTDCDSCLEVCPDLFRRNEETGLIELIDAEDAQDKIARIHKLYNDDGDGGDGKGNGVTPLAAMAALVQKNVELEQEKKNSDKKSAGKKK